MVPISGIPLPPASIAEAAPIPSIPSTVDPIPPPAIPATEFHYVPSEDLGISFLATLPLTAPDNRPIKVPIIVLFCKD
jgi:hypothetical protein